MNYKVIGPKAQVMDQRPNQQPFTGAEMKSTLCSDILVGQKDLKVSIKFRPFSHIIEEKILASAFFYEI